MHYLDISPQHYIQLKGYFPILSDYAKDPLYAWIIIKSSDQILKIAFPECFKSMLEADIQIVHG